MSAYIISGLKACFLGKSNQVGYSANHHVDNFFTKRNKKQMKKMEMKDNTVYELTVGTPGFEFARRALLERGHQKGTNIEDHEVKRMLDVTAEAYCISHALPVPRKGTKAMGVRLARESARMTEADRQQTKSGQTPISGGHDSRGRTDTASPPEAVSHMEDEEVDYLEHQRDLVLRAMGAHPSPQPSERSDNARSSTSKSSSKYGSDFSPMLPPGSHLHSDLRRNVLRTAPRLYWDELHPDDSVSKVSKTYA